MEHQDFSSVIRNIDTSKHLSEIYVDFKDHFHPAVHQLISQLWERPFYIRITATNKLPLLVMLRNYALSCVVQKNNQYLGRSTRSIMIVIKGTLVTGISFYTWSYGSCFVLRVLK